MLLMNFLTTSLPQEYTQSLQDLQEELEENRQKLLNILLTIDSQKQSCKRYLKLIKCSSQTISVASLESFLESSEDSTLQIHCKIKDL